MVVMATVRLGSVMSTAPAEVPAAHSQAPRAHEAQVKTGLSLEELPGTEVGTIHRVVAGGAQLSEPVFLSSSSGGIATADSFQSAKGLAEARAQQGGAQAIATGSGRQVVAGLVDSDGKSIEVDGPAVAGVFQSVTFEPAADAAVQAIVGDQGVVETSPDETSTLYDPRVTPIDGIQMHGPELADLLKQHAAKAGMPDLFDAASLRFHGGAQGLEDREAAFLALTSAVTAVAEDPMHRDRALMVAEDGRWMSAARTDMGPHAHDALRAVQASTGDRVLAKARLSGVELGQRLAELLGLRPQAYAWGDLRRALASEQHDAQQSQSVLQDRLKNLGQEIEVLESKPTNLWNRKRTQTTLSEARQNRASLDEQLGQASQQDLQLGLMLDGWTTHLPEPIRFADSVVASSSGLLSKLPQAPELFEAVGMDPSQARQALERKAHADADHDFALLRGDSGMFWLSPMKREAVADDSARDAQDHVAARTRRGIALPAVLSSLELERFEPKERPFQSKAFAAGLTLSELRRRMLSDPEKRPLVLIRDHEQLYVAPLQEHRTLSELRDLSALSSELGLEITAVVHPEGAAVAGELRTELGGQLAYGPWSDIREILESTLAAVSHDREETIGRYDELRGQIEELAHFIVGVEVGLKYARRYSFERLRSVLQAPLAQSKEPELKKLQELRDQSYERLIQRNAELSELYSALSQFDSAGLV
jgi:hypothetical protein